MFSFVILCGGHALADLPPPPPPLTNEQKVRQAEYVLVGEGRKLVYVETNPKVMFGLLEFDSDSPSAPPHRGAFIEVHVIDVLCQRKDIASTTIRVFLPGDFRSASERRALYLNRQLIYFLKREELQGAGKTQFRYWFIRGPGASEVPVSIDQREQLQPHIDKYCSTKRH